MHRIPAVADQFYPGEPGILQKTLAGLIAPADDPEPALAVIMPHAGYIYSGGVAGETISGVEVPETVIVLGPNHRGVGSPVAIMGHGSWAMPLGEVEINRELAAIIKKECPEAEEDPDAHRDEHSLEVLLPFLQYRRPDLKMVPLCLGTLSLGECKHLGEGLAASCRQYSAPVMLAVSTDMSHYLSRAESEARDHLALERIMALDPDGLYNTVIGRRITMCGIIPTVTALICAIGLGARKARLIRYTDSGEASGDTSRVVGYAGFIIQ